MRLVFASVAFVAFVGSIGASGSVAGSVGTSGSVAGSGVDSSVGIFIEHNLLLKLLRTFSPALNNNPKLF